MELVAAAGLDPPPAPDGVPPVATGTPPEVIVEGEEEDDGTQGLPAAFQRLPPKGGRSAPTLGLPVPLTPALSGAGRADVLACRDGGGQPTAVVDRFTGRRLDVACWMPDGTDSPLPSLAADLEALTP
jgi:hypothetical protein